jgi:hypothetical protein
MRTRAPARRLLRAVAAASVTLIAAAAGSIAAAPQACACTCRTYSSPQEAVRAFDTIFVGVATSKKTEGSRDVYEVDVSLVYTGNVGATATVSTSTGIGSCGTTFTLHDEGLFFVQAGREPGHFSATSCGPTTTGSRYNTGEVLREVYGEPRAVQPVPAPTSSTSKGSNGTLAYVIAGVTAAAVLGAVGGVILLMRRRSS